MASTFLAKKMMEQKMSAATGSLTQPLMAKDENQPLNKDEETGENCENPNEENNEEGDEVHEEKPDKIGGCDLLIMIWAMAGFCLSGLLIVAVGGIFMYIPHGITLLMAPWVIYNQYRIAKNKSIRGWINMLRGDVNLFAEENKKLTLNIDDLEVQNDSLKDFEVGLSAICNQQGKNVDELVKLVRDNREIIDQMKQIVQGEVIQIMIRAVLIGDRDSNFSLDDQDVNTVLMRMDNIEFVEVDKAKFRQFVKKNGGSVDAVLKLVYNLFKEDDDIPEDEAVFNIEMAF